MRKSGPSGSSLVGRSPAAGVCATGGSAGGWGEAADGGEACICDLTAPVGPSQPTVSFHMEQLVEADLVTREQRGKWNYYRVVPEALLAASELLRAPAA